MSKGKLYGLFRFLSFLLMESLLGGFCSFFFLKHVLIVLVDLKNDMVCCSLQVLYLKDKLWMEQRKVQKLTFNKAEPT